MSTNIAAETTTTTTPKPGLLARLAPSAKAPRNSKKAKAAIAKAAKTGPDSEESKAKAATEKAERKAAVAAKAEQARETAHAHVREAGNVAVPCACGCGEAVPSRRFRPGHDARLFSRFYAEEKGKLGIS